MVWVTQFWSFALVKKFSYFLGDFSVDDLQWQSGLLGSNKCLSRHWKYIHKLFFKKMLSSNYSECLLVFFRTTTFKRCTKTLSAKWKILLMYVGLLKTSDWTVIPSTWAEHLMHICVYPVCQLVTSCKLWQKPILSYAIRIFKDKLLTHCYTT